MNPPSPNIWPSQCHGGEDYQAGATAGPAVKQDQCSQDEKKNAHGEFLFEGQLRGARYSVSDPGLQAPSG